MIHLISDTHIFHKRILGYSQRDFSSVEEMNETIIKNWNRLVQPDDTIYHLGDFAFCKYKEFTNLLRRLNGNIHVILGNHDRVIEDNREALLSSGQLKSIQHYVEFKYEGYLFCLFHYPLRSWHWSYRPTSIHCYGHVHNRMKPHGRSLDVGVDSTVITSEYRPVSIKEVIKWAESIKHVPFSGEEVKAERKS